MPNVVWFIKLRHLACMGFDVLDAAKPSPKAGCMMKKGAATVMTPKTIAGIGVGC